MYLKTKGLVLRVTQYNDHDVLLTILTGNYGKLTAKARGLRRKNSPLTAQCQLLAYAEFTLFEYRGMYTVNEATTVELFPELRKDLLRLSLGTYFAQVSETVSQEDTPNPELLSLVLNSLFALCRLKEPDAKVKAAFELRTACLAGYQPDLEGCRECGESNAYQFDLSAGQLTCQRCTPLVTGGIRMPLTAGALEAMRYIICCDSRRLLSFRINEESLSVLDGVAEAYLTTQLERSFPTLDFYKTLLFTT